MTDNMHDDTPVDRVPVTYRVTRWHAHDLAHPETVASGLSLDDAKRRVRAQPERAGGPWEGFSPDTPETAARPTAPRPAPLDPRDEAVARLREENRALRDRLEALLASREWDGNTPRARAPEDHDDGGSPEGPVTWYGWGREGTDRP